MRGSVCPMVCLTVSIGCGGAVLPDSRTQGEGAPSSGAASSGPTSTTTDPARARRCDAPQNLTTMQGAEAIAADADAVYYLEVGLGGAPNRVMKVAVGGGRPEQLASTPPQQSRIALDAEFVYVGAYGEGVFRVSKRGGPLETIVTMDIADCFAVDDAFVYVVSDHGKFVQRAPKAGGILGGLGPARGVAAVRATGGELFWSEIGDAVDTFAYPHGAILHHQSDTNWLTDAPAAFAREVDRVADIAVSPRFVHWIDESGVHRAGRDGSAPSLAYPADGYALALDADERGVVVLDSVEGQVVAIDEDGGRATLATGESSAYHVTVAPSGVFWTAYTSMLGGVIRGVRCR